MTSEEPSDNLADRVTALEQQQRSHRRALGSLDADVSDLQTQRRQDVRLLQSLRQTQVEHGDQLTRLEGRLEGLETTVTTGFAGVESRFGQMDSRFGQMDSRFGQIDSRFEQIDSRFEQIDSRFEQIDSRFEQMDSRFEQMGSRFDALESRFDVVVELLQARDA
ncbi:MAG: hypothetical protein ACXV3A_00665 [Kineosporiaceae bacterium]